LRREEREQRELSELSPVAAVNARSRGRHFPEKEHETRLAFERDRDRVIHCTAFRRMEYKTQVFFFHEGDYFRTRLTHSLEVAQISRSVALALSLNETLAEAVALAHDLGHTPFGHAGERAMDELMLGHGGFEHNRQSLRVVDLLEYRYPRFPGLNLTWEVREGIAKHSSEHDHPDIRGFGDGHPSLEGQIVDLADEIAYNNHDLDDGLTSGRITLDRLSEVSLWRTTAERVVMDHPGITSSMLRHETIRRLINWQVSDLIATVEANLSGMGIGSREQLAVAPRRVAGFSPQMAAMNRELKGFLNRELYQHPEVKARGEEAGAIVEALFVSYLAGPARLPEWVMRRAEADGRERAVCDYVAGMTDKFALDEHRKLIGS
jgi:dGTPase